MGCFWETAESMPKGTTEHTFGKLKPRDMRNDTPAKSLPINMTMEEIEAMDKKLRKRFFDATPDK